MVHPTLRRFLPSSRTSFPISVRSPARIPQPIASHVAGDTPAHHRGHGRARLVAESASRDVTIPCRYDDPDFAPDLQEVAERTDKSAEQVPAGQLASAFKVYHLGFMPGLAYIVGLDPSLVLPRRAEPRVRVPRSSVAIAMDWTTIYPFESPGGWHLIDRISRAVEAGTFDTALRPSHFRDR